jgi:hypothetical protein
MQTIRVAQNDVYNISYTLTNPTINLWTAATPATPSVDLDIIDIDTKEVLTTIPCTVTAPTTGVIRFSTEDFASLDKKMYLAQFRIMIGTTLQSIPKDSEQAVWVY